jgi:hypothetical protein
MLLRRSAVLLVAAGLLIAVGCGKEPSDEHLVDIAVKLVKQQQQLDRIETAVQSIGERLRDIEEGLLAGPAVVEAGSKAASGEGKELSLASAKQYQDLMGQIAVVQSQLVSLEEEILMLRQGQDQVRKRREREALRDQGAAWRAMGEPDELSQRLDILLENFSGNIEDPLTRDAFAAEVEEMKSRYLTPLSPEQKREQARTAIVEAMDLMPDERSKTWLDEQLRQFDEATNPLEIGMRVNVTLQFQKIREMGELAQRYNIPGQVMRDSGLLSLPGGGLLPGRGLFGRQQ